MANLPCTPMAELNKPQNGDADMELPDWLSKIIPCLLGIAALYFAFAGLLDTDYVFSRYEKRLIVHIGNTGLFMSWLLAAIGCFWALVHLSKKSKSDK